jgi:hypothetical protein
VYLEVAAAVLAASFCELVGCYLAEKAYVVVHEAYVASVDPSFGWLLQRFSAFQRCVFQYLASLTELLFTHRCGFRGARFYTPLLPVPLPLPAPAGHTWLPPVLCPAGPLSGLVAQARGPGPGVPKHWRGQGATCLVFGF